MAWIRWPIAAMIALYGALAITPAISSETGAPRSLWGAGKVAVADIRIGTRGTATRIILDLTGATDFIHDVSRDGTTVFIAFAGIRWTIPRSFRRKRGIVTGYAFTERAGGGGSLVLSTAQPVHVLQARRLPPQGAEGHRIVLDLATDLPPHVDDSIVPRQGAHPIPMAEPAEEGPRAVNIATFRGSSNVTSISMAAQYVTETATEIAQTRQTAPTVFGREGQPTPADQGRYYLRIENEREAELIRKAREARQRVAAESQPGNWKPNVRTARDEAPMVRDIGGRGMSADERRMTQKMPAATPNANEPVVPQQHSVAKGRYYAAADLGLSFGNDVAGSVSDSRFTASGSTGFHASGAAGYAWPIGLRAEGEIVYGVSNLDSLTVTTPGSVSGLTAGTFEAEGETSMLALMANAAFDIDTGTMLTPFVLGGIGTARLAMDTVRAGGVDIPDSSTWSLAYQAGAGIGLRTKSKWTMRMTYRYFATQDGGTVERDGGNHAVTLGAKIAF